MRATIGIVSLIALQACAVSPAEPPEPPQDGETPAPSACDLAFESSPPDQSGALTSSRGSYGRREIYHPPGPSEDDITLSKIAWHNIERRGENLLESYKDLYPNEHEATRRACIGSCTTNFRALCGYVKCVCSTGNSRVPFSPDVNTSCRAAKSASCEGNPHECIASCGGSPLNAP